MTLNPSSAPPAARVAPAVFVVAMLVVAGVAIAGTAAYFEFHPIRTTPAAHIAQNNTTNPKSTGPTTETIVDDLGRRVTVPLNASRIVVLAPSILDIVYRLGLRADVVGLGCAPTEYGLLSAYSPNQTSLWDLTPGLCINDYPTLDGQAVANDTPGLVLASTITSAADVTMLTATYGLPVVILAPNGLQGIVGDVALVASMYPGNTMALPLEVSLDGALTNASNLDTNLSDNGDPVPSALLTYYFDTGGYYTYGPGTFGESLIELAGGSNVAGSAPLTYFEMNATVVLNDEPAVVIYGTSWNDPQLVSGETVQNWTAAPYWSQLNGSVHAIDVTAITEADPSMILTLPLLEYWLQPTLQTSP
ncbi:MAG: ABC transporter substrate-binding protein [Thermoplasmata archaeon]|nr:ABC transporter substrate-binding protein [Thermoplasmata archaeon]